MQIHADFTRRAADHATEAGWVPSPMPGVERRMLDRVGGEVARATTIVRYQPGSRFSAHVHDGGEEYLVLDGVFEDENGAYPAGTYVRNPPRSRHAPSAPGGATIFVKLRQFQEDDDRQMTIDTGAGTPHPVTDRPGTGQIPLFRHGQEDVRIEIWAAGAAVTLGGHGGLELLVLEGEIDEGGETFGPLDWLRLPPHQPLTAKAGSGGARLWVKSGHLDRTVPDQGIAP